MKMTKPSLTVLKQPTELSASLPSQEGASACPGEVIVFNFLREPPPAPSIEGVEDVSAYVERQEANPQRKAALERARLRLGEAMKEMGDERGALRHLRLAKGWSQGHLAAELGTSQARISRIEGGREDIAFSFAERMANALGCDLNTFGEALKAARGQKA